MSGAVPIIRQSGEGEQFWFAGGGVFTMKATTEETGGSMTMLEDRFTRGKTTPLHTHPFDEAIYVLDGELLVDVDGDQRSLGAGGLMVAPRSVPHAFLCRSETAHILSVQTPGIGEDFYRAASEPLRSADDASRPGDFARLREVAEQSPSIEIIGPPPFAAAPAAAG
jgi:quercetin dioxygenase-like cupin family protein